MCKSTAITVFKNVLLILLFMVIPYTSYTVNNDHSFEHNFSKELGKLDSDVAKNLTNYYLTASTPNNSLITLIEPYLIDYYAGSGFSSVVDSLIGNEPPIFNAIYVYRLQSRSSILLKELASKIEFFNEMGEITKNIQTFVNKNGWPTFKDLESLAKMILLMQIKQDLNAQEVASGRLSNVQTNCSLSSAHCMEIGSFALEEQKFEMAIEWFELAKELALKDGAIKNLEALELTIKSAINNYLSLKKQNGGKGKEAMLPDWTNTPDDRNTEIKYSKLQPVKLKSLVELEWLIYHRIKVLFHMFRNKSRGILRDEFDQVHSYVKIYLQNFEETSLRIVNSWEISPYGAKTQTEKVAWNPVGVYRTLVRFREYIQFWLVQGDYFADTKLEKEIVKFLQKVYKVSEGPTSFDFDMGLRLILNIQYIHDLPIPDIIAGQIHKINTSVTLNAMDCLRLGVHSMTESMKNNYKMAINWFQHSLFLVRNKSDTSLKEDEVLKELTRAEILHDEQFPGKGWDNFKFFPNLIKNHTSPESVQSIFQVGKSNSFDQRQSRLQHLEEILHGICQGNLKQTEAVKSKLFCWYEREIHDSFKIGPLKAEFHSALSKLEVVQFYDVIGDRLLEGMLNLTSDTPGSKKSREADLSSAGSQNNALIIPSTVMKIVARFTGLKLYHGSKTNYSGLSQHTTGAYYATHLDSVSFPEAYATVLLYASDVAHGGETIFNDVNLKVTPKKGSALIWYNLYTCKSKDFTTSHGFCPVIVGEKFVLPLWIHYDDQNHLKCHLKPNTRHEILMNGHSKLHPSL